MAKADLDNDNQPINAFSPSKIKKFKEKPKIFVYREIDELGLDPYEFRVYSHIARRGNCFATLDKVAVTCCMSVRKVQYALTVLEGSGLIEKEKRNGRTNGFFLSPPSQWLTSMDAKRLAAIRKKVKNGEKLSRFSKKIAVSKENSGDFDPSDLHALDEGDVPY